MHRGLEIYKTKSGFCVTRLHYTADPEKDPATNDGAMWLTLATRGIPGGMKSAAWRREMEIDFSAGGGETVFPELSIIEDEIYIHPYSIPAHWDRYASFDYGHTNPSSIHFYAVNELGWKYVYFEFYSSGMHYKELANVFKTHPDFKKVKEICADPSLWKKDQHSGPSSLFGVRSLADLFTEEGVFLSPHCENSDIKGIERAREHWRRPEGAKALYIFKSCPKLWWELKNLKYQENKRPSQQSNPEKIVDRNNHAWDDLKYFLLRLPEPSEAKAKEPLPPGCFTMDMLEAMEEQQHPVNDYE